MRIFVFANTHSFLRFSLFLSEKVHACAFKFMNSFLRFAFPTLFQMQNVCLFFLSLAWFSSSSDYGLALFQSACFPFSFPLFHIYRIACNVQVSIEWPTYHTADSLSHATSQQAYKSTEPPASYSSELLPFSYLPSKFRSELPTLK